MTTTTPQTTTSQTNPAPAPIPMPTVGLARKRSWAVRLARSYARRALQRRFEGVYVEGLEETRALARATPLIFAANHTSWWDAFAITILDEALETDGFVLMDEENLQRLSFLSSLGALPFSRDDALAARRQLLASTRLLDRPGRGLWIFPQGEQRPAHVRPLGFKAGVRLLGTHCPVVPVAISTVWRNRPEPALLIHLGAPLLPSAERGSAVRNLELAVEAGLHRLDQIGLGEAPLPSPVCRGAQRSAENGWMARLLSRLTRRPV